VERQQDLDRLLTFVDAIVAIAITLLVLPLAELTTDIGDEPVTRLLSAHQSQLWSFLLSFTVIARLWFVQHASVRHLRVAPAGFGFLLMAWTATIVFLPFPTALVADTGSQTLTKILYTGTITLNVVLVAVMEFLIQRDPRLTDGRGTPHLAAALSNVFLLLVSLVLTLLLPGPSYYTLLLLTLDSVVLRLWRRVTGRRQA